MYSKIVHVGELTTEERQLISDVANLHCSNIECQYCPLQLDIRDTPHNNACLPEYARRVSSK